MSDSRTLRATDEPVATEHDTKNLSTTGSDEGSASEGSSDVSDGPSEHSEDLDTDDEEETSSEDEGVAVSPGKVYTTETGDDGLWSMLGIGLAGFFAAASAAMAMLQSDSTLEKSHVMMAGMVILFVAVLAQSFGIGQPKKKQSPLLDDDDVDVPSWLVLVASCGFGLMLGGMMEPILRGPAPHPPPGFSRV